MSDRLVLLASLGLLAAMLGTLGGELLTWPLLHGIAWVGLGLYLLDAWRHLGLKGRGFLVVGLALAAATALTVEAPGPVLAAGLARAAFIATLFSALNMLRDAASTSTVVRRCGLFLADQPPGRRYVALTAGSHLFSIILNFGAVGLLGTLTQRALDGDASQRGKLRERRMMTAIHRGFATILCWSPLTVSMAVVLTALPDTDWRQIVPWCAASALGLTALGWAVDRAIRPPPGLVARSAAAEPGGERWTVLLPILGLVVAVFAVGVAIEELAGVRLVFGVMTGVPVIAALWFGAQSRRPVAAAAARLRDHVRLAFPSYRLEMVILTTGAFIGSLIGALLPPPLVGQAIAAVPLPAWALVALLAWVVVGLGQVGLNPVLSISALAGALPPPTTLGLPPAAIAVALCGAWALTAVSSPFSAGALIVGQMTGTPSTTAGSRWNGPYAVAGLLLLTAWTGAVSVLAQ
jgi:hypothetical protein